MSEPSGDFIERFILRKTPFVSIFIIFLLVWLGSGFYIVNPGEQGVVRQFGREISQAGQGLNYHLPWPIQQVNIVNLEEVRRLEVGFKTIGSSQVRRHPEEALMLTGDENIVEAQVIVQYRIKDPSKYLFKLYDPEGVLRSATEVALRSSVGQTKIDDVLTTGRNQVQVDTHSFLQRLMDDYQSGILIQEVKLQVVDPPDQVKDAFHEVVRAREDRERLINQAKGYQEDVIPKARGKAEQIIRDAEGYKEERILKAKGDAARFEALYSEYQKAKQVTRDRLQIEAMEHVLSDIHKIIIDPSASKNLVPLLPLGENQAIPAAAKTEGGAK
ncbi:MAG: FtsH protease activity modulator HflK [Candidatus Omnitrophica bacterium CG11_big_fil_rev_8_21_14_0_20_45_26]|uniref:Protein HflK n=1 Tax=Candidatus Abzuiibacterium crystallinum TaxID=1974748 RepID=A0A2H0LL35_9BACT|nr:MAG: FtsH protease activity modulator HflK [Candidatus Omnitrophica bacterium CG11_big_fil_rev_8_21_14_0_20_45_26]PIW63836.1 MAG: FtsH protease activity modulator HflK [Candidatus Omnitrophica bacterium CG12_big_fil_rev_8_21_14_0_65_45_16]